METAEKNSDTPHESLENLEISEKTTDDVQNSDNKMETEISKELDGTGSGTDDTDLTDISQVHDFAFELNRPIEGLLNAEDEEKLSFQSLKSEKNPFSYISLLLEIFDTLNEQEIMISCDRALNLILTLILARQPFLVSIYLLFLNKLIGSKCIAHCRKFLTAEYITFYIKSLDMTVSDTTDLETIANHFPGEFYEQTFLLSSPFEKVKIIVKIHQKNNFYVNLNSESWYMSLREIVGNIRSFKEFRDLTCNKIFGVSVVRGIGLDFFIHLISAYVRIGAKVQLSSVILPEDQNFLKQIPLHNQKKGEIVRLTKYREIFQEDELMTEVITRFEQFLNF